MTTLYQDASDADRSSSTARALALRRRARRITGGSSTASTPWNDPELASAVDAVGLEVVVIDREDTGHAEPLREEDERGVREVHGAVGVLRHQTLELREVCVGD